MDILGDQPPHSSLRETPYNQLPLLPPRHEIETTRTLKTAITARTAVAELKAAAHSIPNQGMLIRSLVLQEAKLSSEIENVVTTNDTLYQALSREEGENNPFVKEVLRYSDAVWFGVKHVKNGHKFGSEFYCKLASIIKDEVVEVRKMPGTRIGNLRTREIIYTPPDGRERLEDMLTNLTEFFQDASNIDPLIQMAVAHYQFEAIHPFNDGNGRTGRVLNTLWMVQQNLLDLPILFLSQAVLDDRSRYYRLLQGVTEEWAWEDWIVYMLEIIESTAIDTRRRIDAISKCVAEAKAIIEKALPKSKSHQLAELIFSQPYTRLDQLESAGIAKRHAGAQYLLKLQELGLVKSVKSGRHVLYRNQELMTILGA